MQYLIISIFALGVIAAALGYLLRGRKPQAQAPAAPPRTDCCGRHDVCRQNSPAAGKRIEYYNDEELDRFRETAANAYPEDAVDEFRDVLYTLRPAEVAGWLHSLQLRRITLPAALTDEAFLIMGEQHTHTFA
jgi:hypothetical protein